MLALPRAGHLPHRLQRLQFLQQAPGFAPRRAPAFLGTSRRTRRRPRCCGTCVVSSLGSTLSAVWDVTQRVVLGATAVGAVVACGAATTPGGRRLLRSMSAEFTSSPEGAQVFQLLQYLLLLLVARTFEYITGVTGALTLVYLGIFGMQLQRRVLMNRTAPRRRHESRFVKRTLRPPHVSLRYARVSNATAWVRNMQRRCMTCVSPAQASGSRASKPSWPA